MKVVTIRCDRCGETIDAGRAVVELAAGPRPPTWPTDGENGRPTLDLCGPCLDALTSWLHARPEALTSDDRQRPTAITASLRATCHLVFEQPSKAWPPAVGRMLGQPSRVRPRAKDDPQGPPTFALLRGYRAKQPDRRLIRTRGDGRILSGRVSVPTGRSGGAE